MHTFSQTKSEAEEIIERYHRRQSKDASALYNCLKPCNVVAFTEKYKKLCNILLQNFGLTFSTKNYLEIGCGTGSNLIQLLQLGVPPTNLTGNDIFEPSLKKAQETLPTKIQLQLGNFLDITYQENTYDCIILSTVLSSILDLKFQKEVIEKAYKLLTKNGIILLYDFIFNNPWNPDVKGINLKYIKSICPWSAYNFSKVTLCPPLARKLCHFPYFLKLLTSIKLMNTHIIGFLRK